MQWMAACFIVLWTSVSFASFTPPDRSQTPGRLCSPSDPNFKGYDYPEQVARCHRNVSREDKLAVAAAYGNIPPRDFPKYEFDHLVPLCAGGSNSTSNLWPQPLEQAQIKDQLENDVCLALKAGRLTQAQAIQKMHDWFVGMDRNHGASGHSDVYCRSKLGLSVRFDIVEPGWISHVYATIEDGDGEHQAMHVQGSVAAHLSSPGTNVFTLPDNRELGRLQLFLPEGLNKTGKPFAAALKSADGHTQHLSCTH